MNASADPGSLRRRRLGAALVVLVAAVFLSGLGGVFLFDDRLAIVQNPGLRSLWPPGPAAFPAVDCTAANRPVLAYSLALNYAVSGLQTWSYHLGNIAIHALATLLLFGLIRSTLLRPALAVRFGERADVLAFAIALVFGIHPLQTESVTYIMGRAESLMGLGYLLALYAAARSWELHRSRAWQIVSVSGCLLALGSKEAAVTAPVLIGLYDLTFSGLAVRPLLRRRRWFYLALALTWVPAAWLVIHHPHRGSVGFHLGVSASEYALTQAGVLLYYLQRVVWPWPLLLDLDWPLARTPADYLPAALWLLPLLLLSVFGAARRSPAGFLGAWFFLILAPSSSVVPIVTEVAAEHRMYLPLVAPVSFLVLGAVRLGAPLSRLLRLRRPGRLALAGFSLWCAVLALLTIRRNLEYRDEVQFWQDNAAHAPHSARVQLSLGFALERAGQPEAAAEAYRRAIRLDPRSASARNNLALLLWERGDREGASEMLQGALRLAPDHPDALNSYGTLLCELGRRDEAVRHLERALASPFHAARPATLFNLGRCRLRRGREGDAARAEQDLRQAIREETEFDAGSRFWLARALEDQGRRPEALVLLEDLARRLPREWTVHFALARLLFSEARPDEALAAWRRGWSLHPDPLGPWKDPP